MSLLIGHMTHLFIWFESKNKVNVLFLELLPHLMIILERERERERERVINSGH